MKKIQTVSFALLAFFAVSAANAATTGGSPTAASSIALTTADCSGLKEDVTIQLSSANFGSVTCPDAATVGVGVANMKGKGNSYAASSNGGAVTETIGGAPFADQAAAEAAAAAAATAAVAGSS
jgi:hypothetical protein